jgi:AcrR family transcriptional regulator
MQVITCNLMTPSEFTPKPLYLKGGSSDSTKKRILVAAELVFSRDGFQGATTREIAREAGVNEVTLFRHFNSREQLLRATLEYGCEAFDALVEPEEICRGELLVGLEGYIRDIYSVVKGREAIVRAFIGEARLLPESIRRLLQEFMLIKKARLVALLQRAQERGFVRKEVDVSVAADFIRDSIHSATLRHTFCHADPATVDAHLRGVTDIFYRGIKASDGKDS